MTNNLEVSLSYSFFDKQVKEKIAARLLQWAARVRRENPKSTLTNEKALQSVYKNNWKKRTVTPETLMKHILKGNAFCAAVLLGDKRISRNFINAQLVGIDFDNCSLDTILQHSFVSQHALLAYETASSTPIHGKSRAIFKLPCPEQTAKLYKDLTFGVANAVKELTPDKSTRDPVRIWFGSTTAKENNRYYIAESAQPIDTELLVKDTKTQNRNVTQEEFRDEIIQWYNSITTQETVVVMLERIGYVTEDGDHWKRRGSNNTAGLSFLDDGIRVIDFHGSSPLRNKVLDKYTNSEFVVRDPFQVMQCVMCKWDLKQAYELAKSVVKKHITGGQK